MVANSLLPGWIPIPAPLVIVGMMALFAGVGRVPIAVILMVSEMTGNLTLLAPSMVAVVVSYFVTGPKYTIYRSQVLRRTESPAHIAEYSVPLLTKISVQDAMNPNVLSLSPQDKVEAAYQVMQEKGFRGIPILDSGKVVGIVTMSDILRIPKEKMGSTEIRGVMTQGILTANPDETLLDALKKMTTHGIGRLPVVSRESGEMMGILTRTDVVQAYARVLELTAEAGSTATTTPDKKRTKT